MTKQTNNWQRKEYGGLKTDQVKKLKELKRENARLKKLMAEAHLDKTMSLGVAARHFSSRTGGVKRSVYYWIASACPSGGRAPVASDSRLRPLLVC
ncbi:MAG: hypothetical protein AAFZ67_08450 [Planctomycetota bacterium]